MSFDFSSLNPKPQGSSETDPIEIFQSLSRSDKTINDLWLGQGDALREWYKNRTQNDVVISLNTGAGKTLIGLLIAQSLVNETKGLVIYCCSSIQLVDQTKEKAEGYGLPATTYYRSEFSDTEAQQGKAPLVTTYQSLFNGRSKFLRKEIEAIIFDDSHTAEHILRSQFTLNISKESFPGPFKHLIDEFEEYFVSSGKHISFEEIRMERPNLILMVHQPIIQTKCASIRKTLLESEISENRETKFAWEHIKEHLDLCAF
jgi:hypothetical protein